MVIGICNLEMAVKNVTAIEQVLWHLFVIKVLVSAIVNLGLVVSFVISAYQDISCLLIKDAEVSVCYIIKEIHVVMVLRRNIELHNVKISYNPMQKNKTL